MERVILDDLGSTIAPIFDNHAKLILKLRWIGLDEEAERLQKALSTLPPEARAIISIGPLATD